MRKKKIAMFHVMSSDLTKFVCLYVLLFSVILCSIMFS